MIHQVRLYSGLVMMLFVTGHLINHSLGIISLDAMDGGRPYLVVPWQVVPGVWLLYTAVILHVAVGLYTLYQRHTLKLKKWEAIQLIIGLIIPFMLGGHIIGTHFVRVALDVKMSYGYELAVLWTFLPAFGILQPLMLILVWVHSCLGIHTWLRLKPRYVAIRTYLFSFALLLPTLALAGYVTTGVQVRKLATDRQWVEKLLAEAHYKPEYVDWSFNRLYWLTVIWAGIIIAVLIARRIHIAIANKAKHSEKVYYRNLRDSRVVDLIPGASLLESLRADGIDHASVCGGRGRCTTCRVKVGDGFDKLPPASAYEQRALDRIAAPENVRLACQIHPVASLEVTPLLPPSASATDGQNKLGYEQGEELQVAILFADLRASTKLAEGRMPFDVVYILNQFFTEMEGSLEDSGGHYAQFNGDGLMALYGLDSNIEEGCVQALHGAKNMLRRLDALNQRLGMELQHPLKMGIGIHSGDAIVGKMGPPASPIISALGDNVNIAARLEAQTKELDAEIVVSADTAAFARLDLSNFPAHRVAIRGREKDIDVYALDDPDKIEFTQIA